MANLLSKWLFCDTKMKRKMFKKYFLNRNAQSTGEHEFHTEDCRFLPDVNNRIYLGIFNNCKDAERAAKKYTNNVDGCYYCCSLCHTR